MGTFDKEIAIALPSAKMLPEEQPEECIERLLEQDFPTLCPGLTLGNVQQKCEQRPSRRYGIDTVYFRSKFDASLMEGFHPLYTMLSQGSGGSESSGTSASGTFRQLDSDASCKGENSIGVHPEEWELFAAKREVGTWRIYAWMPPWDFEKISDPAADG